jgi:hypothetical protein
MSLRPAVLVAAFALSLSAFSAKTETYPALEGGAESRPRVSSREINRGAKGPQLPEGASTSSLGSLDDEFGTTAPTQKNYSLKSDQPLALRSPQEKAAARAAAKREKARLAQEAAAKKRREARRKKTLARKKAKSRRNAKRGKLSEVERLRRENAVLRRRVRDLKDQRGADRLIAGTDACQISPEDTDPTFDFVPDRKVSQIRSRLKLVGLLLKRHGRAYDYRAYTSNQLLTLLKVLDDAKGSF